MRKKCWEKTFLLFLPLLVWGLLLCPLRVQAADAEPPEMRRWSHESTASSRDSGQNLKIRATYYSNEYIEALVNQEAEKNLWTRDEMENYKYTLLKTLNLDDSIAFHLDIDVDGVPMYAQPFDKHIYLMIGGKRYTPSDYDRRFNFKLSGKRDGLVHFSRYDEKTGKSLLENAREMRLIFDGSVTTALNGRDFVWIWDLTKDKDTSLQEGKAMNRLEVDRLLKRMDKLSASRADLQGQLDAVNAELIQINARIEELQSQ